MDKRIHARIHLEIYKSYTPVFYPDPSICKKEDEYYLVTSTLHTLGNIKQEVQ